ncbi:MAG: hypothetical protein JRI25_11390 [Deltaproteobacteria bacterium]|nr:hypothetical protein [Deltaproteobacteria bacterium]
MWRFIGMAVALVAVAACDGENGDTDTDDQETFISATVDGASYEGESQGCAFMDHGDSTSELLVWPADRISGSVMDWFPGDIEEYAFTGTTEPVEALMSYFTEESVQYVGTSGSFSIETWEPHIPENAADPLIGYIGGSFHGTFTQYGGTDTVEITNGTFYSRVHENAR